MLIYHYTDLKSAINIVESRKFIAYSNNIYNGDSGLNSFPTLKGGFNYGQNFNKSGVILVFEWTGRIEKDVSINMPPDTMDRDTMYIQGSWRSFIPVFSNAKYLKAIEIIYDDIIDELIKLPFYYNLIPSCFKNLKHKIYEKSLDDLHQQFNQLFKNKDIYINIV